MAAAGFSGTASRSDAVLSPDRPRFCPDGLRPASDVSPTNGHGSAVDLHVVAGGTPWSVPATDAEKSPMLHAPF